MPVKRGRSTVFKRKDGRWTGQISLGYDQAGKRLRPVVYGVTASEVESRLASIRRDHERGAYQRPDRAMDVSIWLDHWLNSIQEPKLRASTFALYKGVITKHIVDEEFGIGKKRLDKFTKPEMVESFYASLRRAGRSDRVVRQVHVILRMALQVAVKRDRLARNPCDLIDAKPTYHAPEMRVLDIEQTGKFVAAAFGKPLEALWILAVDSGCRQGELLGLQWSDIDWKSKTLSVSRSIRYSEGKLAITPPKNKKKRSVSISTTSLVALQRVRDTAATGVPWVFADAAGQPIRKDGKAFRQGFPEVLKAANLEAIRFHDLRHTVATRMLLEGDHPKVVQEKLGHQSIAITLDTYSHVLKGMTGASADRFDVLFTAVGV